MSFKPGPDWGLTQHSDAGAECSLEFSRVSRPLEITIAGGEQEISYPYHHRIELINGRGRGPRVSASQKDMPRNVLLFIRFVQGSTVISSLLIKRLLHCSVSV